ncbi:MAG: 16S rRNA (cytosine(967)-C(5))-methyltransferase RsmB [Lachnospiraceae bacterium]|nr:16S rRNA (cytosine(967)-C(5))-methyltransferase RsmB [Lachnospiraceae bacterium]
MTDKGTILRHTVLEILLAYENTGEKLNLLINDALGKKGFTDNKDRAFIKKLSEGTVERRITLDYVIDRFSNIRSSKCKPVIRNILRMGIYQLLFMDSVPGHAVCNEAVKLAKRKHMGALSGFVNGVLRSVEREGFDISSIPEPDIRYSCPRWIYEKFKEEFGEERAVSVLENSLKSQPVYIRPNITRVSPEELSESLQKKHVVLKSADGRDNAFIISDYGDMTSLDEFKKGLFSVQDLSSMSVGNEIEKTVRDRGQRSFHILDLCAAPGGKSCHAAEVLIKYAVDNDLKIPDFTVESRDVSGKKCALIDENRERLGLYIIRSVVKDGTDPDIDPKDLGRFDLIIADLPCSGLGVMGRKNDLKYRVQPEDIEALSALQRQILTNADKMLKKGGVLIFSVCTVDREETAEQDIWIRESFGYKKENEKLFLPGEEGSDGFYYAVYIKLRAYDRH